MGGCRKQIRVNSRRRDTDSTGWGVKRGSGKWGGRRVEVGDKEQEGWEMKRG